jgi:hypothetical protein
MKLPHYIRFVMRVIWRIWVMEHFHHEHQRKATETEPG